MHFYRDIDEDRYLDVGLKSQAIACGTEDPLGSFVH
jgi:hypothetical protein